MAMSPVHSGPVATRRYLTAAVIEPTAARHAAPTGAEATQQKARSTRLGTSDRGVDRARQGDKRDSVTKGPLWVY